MKKSIKEQYLEYINMCDDVMLDYCDKNYPKLPKQIYTYYKINSDVDYIFIKSDMTAKKTLMDIISFDVYGSEYEIVYENPKFLKSNLTYYKNQYKNYNYKINGEYLDELKNYYNNLIENPSKYFKAYVRFNYNMKVNKISMDLFNTVFFFTLEAATLSFNKFNNIKNFHSDFNIVECDMCKTMFQKDKGCVYDFEYLRNPNVKFSDRIYDTIQRHVCSKKCLERIKNSQKSEFTF